MELRHKTDLQERLAAEYVLGTLRGRARERFRRRMTEDASVASAVAIWEARLSPMSAAVVPVKPRARVWRVIEQRLGAEKARAGGVWDNLVFWRSVGLIASGTAVALLVAAGLNALRRPEPAIAPVVVRTPAGGPDSYLAVLSDPKTQKPVLLVSAGRTSDLLSVKTLDPAIRVADRSLELWALPAGGKPRSLGLISAGGRTTLKLASIAERALAEVSAVAVSLEPKGGSPTGAPTGPVLFSGSFVKSW